MTSHTSDTTDTGDTGDGATRRPPCPEAATSVTCEHCVEFLLDYLDGRLPEPERFRFESHVALCRDCQVYLENYRQAAALAGELARDRSRDIPPEVPEGLVDAILRARRHEHG